jgi:hypothetical protein
MTLSKFLSTPLDSIFKKNYDYINVYQKNGSIINNLPIVTQKLFNPSQCTLLIVRFSKISIALYEAIWFEKSQHDRIKQNKIFTFINKLNYVSFFLV